jgi:hypothetical protein
VILHKQLITDIHSPRKAFRLDQHSNPEWFSQASPSSITINQLPLINQLPTGSVNRGFPMRCSSPPFISQSRWGRTIIKLTVHVAAFAAAECLLNVAGLDTLADYYEFLSGERAIAIADRRLVTANIGHLEANSAMAAYALNGISQSAI